MNATKIRPCAVAGSFYPAEPALLRAQAETFLHAANPAPYLTPPKALIVPHAGYIYSGATAGLGYASIAPLRGQVRRVILLGPNHRVPLDAMALPGTQAFASPLGTVPIDAEAWAVARALPGVVVDDRPHAQEHALEVQLPFLQLVLGDFAVLPIVVGQVSPTLVAGLLNTLWGGAETLIVVSSDLSHYLPYSAAQTHDTASVASLLAGGPMLSQDQACGATPINGLMLAARAHGLKAQLIQLCNSGDTAGDRARVVGYAALAFRPTDNRNP